MRLTWRSTALALGTLSLLGCQDTITAPPTAWPDRPTLNAGRVFERVGDVTVTCSVYSRASGGIHGAKVRVRQLTVRFPQSEAAPAGATRSYQYRGYANGADLVLYSNCEIPATDAAVRRMNAIFRVKQDRGSQGPPTSGPVLMGCVSEGSCTLDPITVTACQYGGEYPNCNVPGDGDHDYDWCGFWNECGGGSGGWDWSGGSGGSNGGWNDAQDDGTNRPPCTRDADGVCVTRPLTSSEWTKLGQRISSIKEHSEECRGAKDALLAMFEQGSAAGRFKFWDGYDVEGGVQRFGQNLSDAGGRFIEFDSHWVWDMATLIVHEGLHAYLHLINSPMSGASAEEWIRTVQGTCV